MPAAVKFTAAWLRGIFILLLVAAIGALITYAKDIRHNPRLAPNFYQPGQNVLVTVAEPPVEKPKSWKAEAEITAIQVGQEWKKADGKVLLYFYKGKKRMPVTYGTQLILGKPLQNIKNSGNPGGFDYERYCRLQNICYQVFIYPGEYKLVAGNNGSAFKQMLFNTRNNTIAALRKYIPGEQEQGVAEALLLGYRADLDSDLVQAYTNTGVIHIVAISGLHLAMIYALLAGIWGLLPVRRFTRIAKPLTIFIVLWAFTLLAGGVPSIARAAVMFSFLVLGEALGKRTNTYNNLAASAFVLLAYNPFYLWDAGFMLSYAAVISIIAFYRPVYNWFYIKNKLLDKLWAATAVTISAQILTFPIILFYFHQFANFFLLANFIAVPLSGIILYGELALLLLVFIPPLAHYIGIATGFMIKCLDGFIQYVNHLPFAVWANIYADVPQTLLLYACIIAAATWLVLRVARALTVALVFLVALVIYSSLSILAASKSQKMIVYNVPKQTAIDIIQGSACRFIGDSALLQDGPLLRYNLTPARTMYRTALVHDTLFNKPLPNNCIVVNNTRILLLNSSFNVEAAQGKIAADIIIISQKPKITMADINNSFTFKQLVFDSSNPLWKIRRWKKDCDSLHLRFYSVPEQGAFEMDL